jgi:hypothetical protein
MQRPRFSPVEVSIPPDSRTVLFDSGYPHLIVRGGAAMIALVSIVLCLDVIASFFNLPFLNFHAPLGRLVAFLATSGLAWWCSMFAFARNVLYLDSESNRLLMYGPGMDFRLKEYFSVAVSKIAAIAVQYHHSPGPGGRHDWTIEWIDGDGSHHGLVRLPVEEDAQVIARRIGQAIGKPVE